MISSSKLSSEARVTTAQPTRYLEQICKHFEHKIPVTRSEGGASITFSSGLCQLATEANTLILQASADDASALESLEDVVARHLKRFAFREGLDINWTRAA